MKLDTRQFHVRDCLAMHLCLPVTTLLLLRQLPNILLALTTQASDMTSALLIKSLALRLVL